MVALSRDNSEIKACPLAQIIFHLKTNQERSSNFSIILTIKSVHIIIGVEVIMIVNIIVIVIKYQRRSHLEVDIIVIKCQNIIVIKCQRRSLLEVDIIVIKCQNISQVTQVLHQVLGY